VRASIGEHESITPEALRSLADVLEGAGEEVPNAVSSDLSRSAKGT
jgi:hypothetical protein